MRNSLWLKIAAILVFVVWVGATAASAIELTGNIRGVVTDPSGAVVAGATVTATNTQTGVSTKVTSNTDGSYEFVHLLAPSTYNVRCEKTGFKAFQATGIPLRITQIYVQNIQMQLGAVSQQVTVEAAPVQVEKTSMQLGATLTGTQITSLPLATRNWVQLQQTLPGVVAAADARGNYATNGSQPGQNSYLVNGIDTNDLPLNTPTFILSPDAIGEVKMITNTLNPEYGRNSGAILSAVTKSGTNRFHGDAFEFYRDTGLNARNFFQPTSLVYHQNEFGGTIGGPIKKDKAFFFFSYQGTRNRIPDGTGATTVFTQDQRNGIWTGDVGTLNCVLGAKPGQTVANTCNHSPFPMYGDSASPCPVSGGVKCPAGTAYNTVKDYTTGAVISNGLFTTGTIPTQDFNPLAVSLMNKFVPLPNCGSGCSEYDFNPVTTGTDNQFYTRIDYNLSSKDTLWGSWLWESHPSTDTLPFTGADLPGFGEQAKRKFNEFVLTWNHTFNGTTYNELRLGYNRFNFKAVEPLQVATPASLGFPGIVTQDPAVSSYPLVSLTGFFTLGFSTNGPQPRKDEVRQLNDNFTKIVGNHTFKMGINVSRFNVYNPFYFNNNGNYGFGGTGQYSTYEPGADFLLGIPDSYSQGSGDTIQAQAQEYYAYFQDQWKIRKNLTLTYGTGYQVDTPTEDVFHNNHAQGAWRPGMQSTVYPNAPLGYVFQGDPGAHVVGTTKYGHFGPRFGFAWSPGSSGKWSIRGGYGVYFNKELEEQTLQNIGQPPYAGSSNGVSDQGLTPNFGSPFTDITGTTTIPQKYPFPTNPAPNIDFSQFLPAFLFTTDPNYSVPYSQNFQLTVEHQFSTNTLLRVGYVGALGRKEVIVRELNPGRNPAACLADPACVSDRGFQGFDFPSHFSENPFVFAGIGNNQTTGISNYNALQVVLDKHMSHGLQFHAVYTWSKSMDNGSGFENSAFGGGGFGGYGSIRATNPFNDTLNYGPSAFDAANRFVISYTYLIPPIHHFDNWAAKRVFSGWEMSGVTTLQSGFPLDVVDSSLQSLTCWYYTWTACWDVPNEVGTPQYLNPRTSNIKGTDHYWFNPSAFQHAPLGQQGNAARNLLRGPGIANFDWGFFKKTPITETTSMELRFEFFNLFNHTQFSSTGVSTNINSGNFGRILAARDPRIIQLAAKFFF